MNRLERPAIRLGAAEDALIGLLREAGADAAAARLGAEGLPTRRVEAYHFTDLKALLRDVPTQLAAEIEAGESVGIEGTTAIRLVNGRLVASDRWPAGVDIVTDRAGEPLGEAMPDMLAAALAPGTARIGLTRTLEQPLHISIEVDGVAAVSAARVDIEVAEGVVGTVIVTLSGSAAAHFVNAAVSVRLGAGANLTFVQVDAQDAAVRQIVHTDFRLGADATLRTLTVNRSSSLSRADVSARFEGAGAHADFTGLNLIGDSQHADISLNVSHAVPDTTSQELFKSVVRGRAKAVFQGKIVVERGAQKTDAKMMAQGLILTEGAEIMHKPELEIFADDVVCGHGATCGALDENSLFYLMSRGLPRPEAESMLIEAFVAELVEPIEAAPVRALLGALVADWLGTPARAEAA